jgi:chorismate mutase
MRRFNPLFGAKSSRSKLMLAPALLLPLLQGGCRTLPPEDSGPTGSPRPTESATLDSGHRQDLRNAADRLLGLMGQRLALMHEVARWKWAARKPIADPARERELLDRVARRSRSKGLDPAFARGFFAAQMEAGKLVQRADFDRWQAEMPAAFPEARDLALVRRDIDALNERLMDALAAAAPRFADPAIQVLLKDAADRILAGDGIDDAVRETAMAPLTYRYTSINP